MLNILVKTDRRTSEIILLIKQSILNYNFLSSSSQVLQLLSDSKNFTKEITKFVLNKIKKEIYYKIIQQRTKENKIYVYFESYESYILLKVLTPLD